MDLQNINKRITDRKDVWFWQADLNISFVERQEIWADKHKGITNDELLSLVNKHIKDIPLASIEDYDENHQNNLGFVNSVRTGKLTNGKDVIIRCHPRGIREEFFHVESLIADTIAGIGIPTYKTYFIHRLENENDIAFQLIEKCNGTALKYWFEKHPEDINKLMHDAGMILSKIHSIHTIGFGPFDSEQAKNGKLIGIHKDFISSVRAGLNRNLKVLEKYKVITNTESKKIDDLFNADNPLLVCEQPVLVHTDLVDWNMLTSDGCKISAILDYGDCVSSDPIVDIAFWSSRTPLDRIDAFLSGYFESKARPEDFDEKFKLFSLRFVIMSMATRVQRAEFIKTKFMQELLELGKEQLEMLLIHFDIK